MEQKSELVSDELLKTISSKINQKIDVIFPPIGRGGQKQVFRIKTPQSGNLVLKIIFVTPDSVERTRREIRAVNLINHPNVPKIYYSNVDSVVVANSVIWIVEEYINGNSLRFELNSKRNYTINEIYYFLETILSVLILSEKCHIVHRDIKPENIMVSVDRKFYLIDFGIARHLDLDSLTATNAPYGPCTLGYSSSEQLRNRKKDIDTRADLFSLAVVTTEMILGSNPYTNGAQNILQIVKNIEQMPLPALQIYGDTQFLLAKFIKTMGDNRMSRRPANAKEAMEMLEMIKGSLSLK